MGPKRSLCGLVFEVPSWGLKSDPHFTNFQKHFAIFQNYLRYECIFEKYLRYDRIFEVVS